LASLWWFELVLPRFGLNSIANKTRTKRLQRIARSFQRLALDLSGLLIKLGQFMSTRLDILPAEITKELEGLQDEVPAVDFALIRAMAESELGLPLEQVFASVESTPLAAASLGQVHRAVLSDGEAAELGFANVVLKIQRPGIDGIVEVDLSALRRVAGWLSRIRLVNRRADAPALMDEFAATCLEEIDYLNEAANAERFAENFADNPRVRVPGVVWERSTRRVLVQEDVTNIKITDLDALRAVGIDPAQVADEFAAIMFDQVFIHGFFHADPHPGNIVIREGKIVWLDLGMVGRITGRDKEQFSAALKAMIHGDVMELKNVALSIGIVRQKLNHAALYNDIDLMLARYSTADFASINLGQFLVEMNDLMSRHHIGMPE
ncbi:MAG: AarF/UbiB family protein, partial [Aurantimicrobium sp.]